MRAHHVEPDMENRGPDGFLMKALKFGWGVVFVAVMTVLSECGPHTVYSKVITGPVTAAPQPSVHCVK